MVAKALATNTVLKSLDLQQAQIGVPGGKAIAAALKANIPLMNLKLHYNHLGPEGTLCLYRTHVREYTQIKRGGGWQSDRGRA